MERINRQSLGGTDYRTYSLSGKERTVVLLAGAALLAVIGYIFYQSWAVVIMLALLAIKAPGFREKQLIRSRQRQLNLQFKQALLSLASLLGAGKSVETAFKEATADLLLLYPDPDTFIIQELDRINMRLEAGDTIENALLDLCERSGSDDIRNFTDVFIICKRTGGNLIQVIRRTSLIIHDKLEIEQEIAVMLSQKKFESRALTVAPVVIIALLAWSSPDYMAPLYSGWGSLLMTVCLLVLTACYRLSQKIVDVKV
jgi:tight adherence protein B